MDVVDIQLINLLKNSERELFTGKFMSASSSNVDPHHPIIAKSKMTWPRKLASEACQSLWCDHRCIPSTTYHKNTEEILLPVHILGLLCISNACLHLCYMYCVHLNWS